ncbi:MAG TPA: hypothetical protein VFQ45_22600 [Longimicrobium sp.]|nr:hypothetical protein [Longimicrobium sp.]
MSAAARRVRRVRLSAPREDLVRRGALLLEDALHTATVPGGGGGRLLLVRRLDVGRIRAGASPATLALEIERRLRQVEASAVHGADPSAAAAPAVWFRDAAEAAAVLAVRLARGAGAEAWFWRPAVRGWEPGAGPAEGIRLALRAAAETPAGPVAVAEVLRASLAAGTADRLLSCLTPSYATVLLALGGWSAPARRPSGAPPFAPPPGDSPASSVPVPPSPRGAALHAVAPEWRHVVARWILEWGDDDVRSVWLACMALIATRPARAADRTLPDRATALVGFVVHENSSTSANSRQRPKSPPESGVRKSEKTTAQQGDAAQASSPPPADLVPSAAGDDGMAASASPIAVQGDGAGEQTGGIAEGSETSVLTTLGPRLPNGPTREQENDEIFAPPAIARADSALSDAAGLFFLVPAMRRLGMDAHLAAHPHLLEAELPVHVLLRIAEKTCVPPGDPALDLLGRIDRINSDPHSAAPEELNRINSGAALPFTAPEAWTRLVARAGEPVARADGGRWDASGRLPLALPAATLDEAVDAWVAALRRLSRLHARMGLRALVRRPGRVEATRTHLDVTLPFSAADVRVRAAGLDLDPGWVPWLGRVAAFHYTDE